MNHQFVWLASKDGKDNKKIAVVSGDASLDTSLVTFLI